MMKQFKIIQQSRDYPSICWELESHAHILITACPASSLEYIDRDPVEAFGRMYCEVDRAAGVPPTPETFSPVGVGTDFAFLSPLEDDDEPFYKWTRFGWALSYYIEGMSMLVYDLVEERFGTEAFNKFLRTPFMQMIRDCDDGPQAIYELKGVEYDRFIACHKDFQRSHEFRPHEYSHLRFMLMPNEVARQYCEQILMVMGMVYGPDAEEKYIREGYEPQNPKPLDWMVEGELKFCRTIVEDGWHMLIAQPMERK